MVLSNSKFKQDFSFKRGVVYLSTLLTLGLGMVNLTYSGAGKSDVDPTLVHPDSLSLVNTLGVDSNAVVMDSMTVPDALVADTTGQIPNQIIPTIDNIGLTNPDAVYVDPNAVSIDSMTVPDALVADTTGQTPNQIIPRLVDMVLVQPDKNSSTPGDVPAVGVGGMTVPTSLIDDTKADFTQVSPILYVGLTPGSSTPTSTPSGDAPAVGVGGMTVPAGTSPAGTTGDQPVLYVGLTPGSSTPTSTPSGDAPAVGVGGMTVPAGTSPAGTTGDQHNLQVNIDNPDTVRTDTVRINNRFPVEVTGGISYLAEYEISQPRVGFSIRPGSDSNGNGGVNIGLEGFLPTSLTGIPSSHVTPFETDENGVYFSREEVADTSEGLTYGAALNISGQSGDWRYGLNIGVVKTDWTTTSDILIPFYNSDFTPSLDSNGNPMAGTDNRTESNSTYEGRVGATVGYDVNDWFGVDVTGGFEGKLDLDDVYGGISLRANLSNIVK